MLSTDITVLGGLPIYNITVKDGLFQMLYNLIQL